MSSGFSGVRFERWNALIYRAHRAGNPDDDLSAGYSVIHVSTPLVGEKLFLLVGGTESGSSTNIGFRKEKGQLNRNISENHSWLGLRGRNRKWEYLISLGQKGYFRGAGEAAATVKMNVRNEMSLSIWVCKVRFRSPAVPACRAGLPIYSHLRYRNESQRKASRFRNQNTGKRLMFGEDSGGGCR